MAIIASRYVIRSFSFNSKNLTEIFSLAFYASKQICGVYVAKPVFLYHIFVVFGTILICFAYRFGRSKHYEVVDTVGQKRVIATFTITGRGTIGNFCVVHPITFARNCLKSRSEVQLFLERLALESGIERMQVYVKHCAPLAKLLTELGFETVITRCSSSYWCRFSQAWCLPVRMSYQLRKST